MDQLIEKVVIEGAEIQIIQRPATLYAGYREETDNGDEESNVDTSQLFQAGYKNIKNSLTPDSMLCLSINYKECNHGKSAAVPYALSGNIGKKSTRRDYGS